MDTKKVAIVAVGALALAGIGYGIYRAVKKTCPEGYQLDDTGTCVPIIIPEGIKVTWESGLGDVNNDGYVTQADVDMVTAIILGKIIPTEEEFVRADCNKDGLVNATDISYVKAILDGRWVPEI